LRRVPTAKADGGERVLGIPSVRDRIAQTAATLVLSPLFDREFEDVSFGYRRRRSVRQAVARVRRHYQDGYHWVVDADIDDFFERVEHRGVLARVRKSVQEREVLRLITEWLKAPWWDGRRCVQRARGLPQGAPISPLLANLYLDQLDQELLRRNMRLVRFADDFLVLCKDRPRALKALEITRSLLNSLNLSLDRRKSRITHFNTGFRYLGHLFVRSLVLPSPARAQRARGAARAAIAPGQTSANMRRGTARARFPASTAVGPGT
jgi:group II intron reverse transcriptase/maturase